MIDFSDIYNYVQSINLTNSYNVIDYVDENDQNISLDKNKTNGSIFYNSESYIAKIYESFDKLDNNVWSQVGHDIGRTVVYYNNNRVYSVSQLQQLVSDIVYAMLSTQAAFFLPFRLMHELFSDIDDNIYVMNEPMNRSVNITNNNIILECMFKVYDVSNDCVLNYLNVKLLYGPNNVILWSRY